MSLELKIEQLTAAVEKLTAALVSMELPQPTSQQEQTPPTQQEQTKEPTPVNAVTLDDLRQLIMDTIRADRANKDKLTALIQSFGAKTSGDLKPEQIPQVYDKIKQGEF